MFRFKHHIIITKKEKILLYCLMEEFHYTVEELAGLSTKSLNRLLSDLLYHKKVQQKLSRKVNN